jgi:hypothetical protein
MAGWPVFWAHVLCVRERHLGDAPTFDWLARSGTAAIPQVRAA